MRILVVTSQYPVKSDPQRGRAIHQTVAQLARLCDVRIVSPVAAYPLGMRPRSYVYRPMPSDSEQSLAAKYVTFPVIPVVTRPVNGWLCARAIASEVENSRPDVILSYWLYPDAYGALVVARRLGIPLVAGARGSDLRARDVISRCMAGKVVRHADRLLVVSDDLGKIAVERDGADPGRVRVIQNGCDSQIFRLSDRRAAREKLGVAVEATLALYVGRLVAEKGLRELLDAMTILCNSATELALVIAGDGPLRTELEERARRMPPGSVRLVGALAPEDVAAWMTAADMVVLPSYSEGYPNVLVEALACGRPVVTTPVGGTVEIADDTNAVMVRPRDPSDLARGIHEAASRAWDQAALSRRHSRDWETVARQTLAACVEALKSRS
jgi:glycosyltransferase involved in cell wall biosynthesis